LQLNVFVAVQNDCLTFHTRARFTTVKIHNEILHKNYLRNLLIKKMLINIVTEAAAHFFSWALNVQLCFCWKQINFL